ncbi:MAG: hypothetical protein JW727_00450 [Candidatus Aenigmarchaeota archaeon]|nr:hypothetical protein [Candidatus Aenigmarchaeota archaeon]
MKEVKILYEVSPDIKSSFQTSRLMESICQKIAPRYGIELKLDLCDPFETSGLLERNTYDALIMHLGQGGAGTYKFADSLRGTRMLVVAESSQADGAGGVKGDEVRAHFDAFILPISGHNGYSLERLLERKLLPWTKEEYPPQL